MYYRKRDLFFVVLFLLAVQLVCGCREVPPRPEGLPRVYSCNISVKFGGKPISGVRVMFIPDNPESKWKPTGMTDTEGNVVLYSSFGYEGAPAGEYTATFSLIEEPEDSAPRGTPAKSLIPLKYSPDQSQEKVEVVAGKNNFDFDLDAGEELVPMKPKG
ncbi:MAG: hypothetical protein LBC74_13785 [Planctomycetaceae bacterium]|jgi:hypothetical protein|nr:hypothetical protein [Planctomycetaceae bacterium]